MGAESLSRLDPHATTLTFHRFQVTTKTVCDNWAILAKCAWIPGVGDVARVTNADGEQFIAIYRKLGLKIELAD
jgi:hypothetical protein